MSKVAGSDSEFIKSNFQRSIMSSVERQESRAMGVVEERVDQASEADKAYGAIKAMMGDEDEVLPKNRVKLVLGTSEKMSLYRNILDRLNADTPNERTAHEIVAYMIGFLSDKEKTANSKGAKKGPIFRRSDQS